MTGEDKLRKKAEELRAESEQEVKLEKAKTTEALNALDRVRENQELAQKFNENAAAGSDNLSGSSPQLKVFFAGKTKEKLANGDTPTNGYFLYTPTGEEFETIDVHVLSISRPFYSEGLEVDKSTGKKKIVFNQLLTGVIATDNRMQPFIAYYTGSKLGNLWAFGKDARKYTKMKPIGIPMFTLLVHLTTRFEETKIVGRSDSWLVEFEILKDEGGYPILVEDVGRFEFLRAMVDEMQEIVDAIIEKKSVDHTPRKGLEEVREQPTSVRGADDYDPGAFPPR